MPLWYGRCGTSGQPTQTGRTRKKMNQEETVKLVRKLILDNGPCRMYTDTDIIFWLEEYENDIDATVYYLLNQMAIESTVAMTGLTLPETKAYYQRQAKRYRPNHSGVR